MYIYIYMYHIYVYNVVAARFSMGRVPRTNHTVEEGLSRSRHLMQESTTGNRIKVFRVSVRL